MQKSGSRKQAGDVLPPSLGSPSRTRSDGAGARSGRLKWACPEFPTQVQMRLSPSCRSRLACLARGWRFTRFSGTTSTKSRLPLRLRQGSVVLPGQCGSIFAHRASARRIPCGASITFERAPASRRATRLRSARPPPISAFCWRCDACRCARGRSFGRVTLAVSALPCRSSRNDSLASSHARTSSCRSRVGADRILER